MPIRSDLLPSVLLYFPQMVQAAVVDAGLYQRATLITFVVSPLFSGNPASRLASAIRKYWLLAEAKLADALPSL